MLPPPERRCGHCREPLVDRREDARYCSDACRNRAHRRRRCGVRESAYSGPRGASRGRVPLGYPLTDGEVTETFEVAFPRLRETART